MTSPRKTFSRRTAIAGLGGLALAAQTGTLRAQPPQPPPPEPVIPVKGKAGPGMEPFDPAMLTIMDRHGIPGAALAIVKDGKLLLAKGYGWANVTSGEPVLPDTLFGLASLSKTFTATAVLHLIDQGKLKLEDKVFGILKHIQPPRGARVDPRLHAVTVRQCLDHSGGWDREISGDPINWEPQICRAFRLRPPMTGGQLVSFVLGMPLNFDPGTQEKYSNVGYIVLGEVIAHLSGQPYHRYVAGRVLQPMGITRARLHGVDGKYLPGEAYRHLAGTLMTLPPMQLPMVNACGGWSASAVDLARYLSNLDGSRGQPLLSAKVRKLMLEPPPEPLAPRPNGSWYGLGWDSVIVTGKTYTYAKDGSYPGMRTFMKRMTGGASWALLYNASMEFDAVDMRINATTVHEVRQLVENFDKYPDIDLFKEYP